MAYITIKGFNKTAPKVWIYHNASLWLLSLSWDWQNWITMTDKNLGASQVYHYWDTMSETNCWKFYQWWNNYWFDFNWTTNWNSTLKSSSWYWPTNYYNSNILTCTVSSPYDWSSNQNDDLWWWVTDTLAARRWPCESWFHVPTKDDFDTLYNIMHQIFWIDSIYLLSQYLYLPIDWQITTWWDSSSNWTRAAATSWWTLYNWSSISNRSFNSFWILWMTWYERYQTSTSYRRQCSPIRPFKNEVVIPDNTWTCIYNWYYQPWIYHNASQWLISLSSDWINWITMADKNLWATQVYNYWDTMSQTNCWKQYQRWNNYWFSFSWSVSTSKTQVNTSNYWPTNPYSSSTFYLQVGTNQHWSSPINSNLWWDTNNTLVARKWPCDTWYHVPTKTELENIISVWNDLWSSWSFTTILKLPLCWYRAGTNGSIVTGNWSSIWTSSSASTDWAYRLYFDANNNNLSIGSFWTFSWFYVRPFKNDSVVPTSSRTVLYQ